MDFPGFVIALGQLFNQFITIVIWPLVVVFLIYTLQEPLRVFVTRLTRDKPVPPPPSQIPPTD